MSANADVESLKKLADNKMEVVPVSAAMMSDMRKMATPLLDEYLKRAPAAAPFIKSYLDATGRK